MKNNADKEINELTRNIQAAQTRINAISAAIGRAYYTREKNSPDPEFAQMFSDMAAAEKQVDQMQTRIKFLNGIVVCTNCKADNSVNSAFCAACGSRLPHTFTADGANRCTRCGNIINPGQLFCGNCGQKVEKAESAQQPAPAQRPVPTPVPVAEPLPVREPVFAAEPVITDTAPVPAQPEAETAFSTEAAVTAESAAPPVPESAPAADAIAQEIAGEPAVSDIKPENLWQPQPEAVRCCPNCNTPVKVADALFCAECGTRLR